MKRELIALVAHEINRAYCASLGDTSVPAWADAPAAHQASMLAGVDMHLANPDATPEASHAAWLETKTAEGWTYAEVKNVEAKQHPCMLPYDQLPAAQKSKDYLFRAAVHALAGLPDEAASEPRVVTRVVATNSAYTPIRYIGKRETHTDGAYGTRLTWAQGQTLPVPVAAAAKMLAHPDVYQVGDPITEELAPPPDTKQSDDEDRLQDLRDSINVMTKAGLVDFVKTNYRVDLNKSQNIGALRAQAIQLVDQFGIT